MQGWRKRMEDSHISDMNLGPNNSTHLFGVFDGHGGNFEYLFFKAFLNKKIIYEKRKQI